MIIYSCLWTPPPKLWGIDSSYLNGKFSCWGHPAASRFRTPSTLSEERVNSVSQSLLHPHLPFPAVSLSRSREWWWENRWGTLVTTFEQPTAGVTNPVPAGTKLPPRTTQAARRSLLKLAQLTCELHLKFNSILLLFFFKLHLHLNTLKN